MKKLILLMLLTAMIITVFTACSSWEEQPITPGTAPVIPPYQPEPLTVEFFVSAYQGMSDWKKYPSDDTKEETPPVTDQNNTSPEA